VNSFTYEELFQEIKEKMGLSAETITLFTGFPQKTIENPRNHRFQYGNETYQTQHYLLFMLAQILHNKPDDNYEKYVQEKILCLINEFHMSETTIIRYLGISNEEYTIFLEKPQKLSHDLIMRITITVLFLYICMVQNPYLYMGKGT